MRPSLCNIVNMPQGRIAVGSSITIVSLNCFLEQRSRAGEIIKVHAIYQIDRLHDEIVSVHAFRTLPKGAAELRLPNVRRNAPYYTGGNTGLEVEEFRYRAIVAISPDNRAGLNVRQFSCDTQLVEHSPHAPCQNVAHPKVLPHLLDVDRLVFVEESGRTRNHKETSDARERDNYVFDHPFAEVGVFRAVAPRPKGQDRYRGHGCALARPARAGSNSTLSTSHAQRIGSHRSSNVLQAKVTKIFDRDFYL